MLLLVWLVLTISWNHSGYATRVGDVVAVSPIANVKGSTITRAVLQHPSLLILDEATSALDYITSKYA